MKSVMQHQFSQIPKVQMPRSSFDRSHGVKTTFDSGYLVPFFVDEALPGDTFNLRTAGFARLSTPLFPFLDNVFMETFYFAVPYRLIWDNFQKMMGEQVDPGDSTDFLVPILDNADSWSASNQSIFDYMGIPTDVTNLDVSALPLRAYNLIYNTWFRDENLQDSLDVPRTDGPDDPALYSVVRRGKRHDYFTSCLPWPQKGPAVDLPIGGTATVTGIATGQNSLIHGLGMDDTNNIGGITVRDASGAMVTYPAAKQSNLATGAGGPIYMDQFDSGPHSGYPNVYAAVPNLTVSGSADLSTATAATINAFRQALQLQVMYERDARGGTRYTEIIRSHFGVVSPDARLQRPEFLGGGSQRININPVPSTTDLGLAQSNPDYANTGTLRAFGTCGFTGHGFTKSFVEHSIIIGLVNVRADITYQQGLNKMWSRRHRYDFYWPALSTIGEQAVLNREIYAQGTADDDLVFGYQERYAEYRYKPSTIHGQFRSNYAQSLDSWHLAQDFGSLPTLSPDFIVDNPPIDRVVIVEAPYPQFIADFYHSLRCARPMPLYGIPGSIMRF